MMAETDDRRERVVSWLPWPKRPPVVPVIRLSGVIGTPMLRGTGLALATLESTLERAFKVRQAKAVALAINSPGGSPVQSALIGERIRALATRHERKVIAFVEDVGASGGYWLALAADEIFADANSIVGSIGVVYSGFGFPEAIGRLGVERRLFTAGEHKSLLDPFRPENPDDVARLRAMLQEIHDSFKAYVRSRRGDRLKGSDEAVFEGQVFTGRRALEVGLIDGVGHLPAVLRERFGDKVRLPVLSPGRSWLQRRLGLGSAGLASRALGDGLLASLEERAHWARFGL
jgi:serine protease SohB